MIRVANGWDDIFLHTRVDKDNMDEIDDKAQQPTVNSVLETLDRNFVNWKLHKNNIWRRVTLESLLWVKSSMLQVGNYKKEGIWNQIF